jgi:GH25 family lysozyme M1 (1,4-beta-N-acetylmuramidase)
MVNLRVADIYHGDRVSSFKKAADFGIWGIIHKATTGATGKDAKYPARRKTGDRCNAAWGAYHWGTKADVAKQVKNFLDFAEPDQNTLVPLDYECTRGNTMTLDQAREFLTRIEEQLRRKAVIYSGDLIKTRLGNKRTPSSGRTDCG